MEQPVLLHLLKKKNQHPNPTTNAKTIPKQQKGKIFTMKKHSWHEKKKYVARSRKIVDCLTLLECFTKSLISPYGIKSHSSPWHFTSILQIPQLRGHVNFALGSSLCLSLSIVFLRQISEHEFHLTNMDYHSGEEKGKERNMVIMDNIFRISHMNVTFNSMRLIVRSLWPKCCPPKEHTPLYPTPVVTGYQTGLYHIKVEYWPQTMPLTMCVKCKGTQHYLSHWVLQTSQMHIMVYLTCLLGGFHSQSSIPAQGQKIGNKLFCKSWQFYGPVLSINTIIWNC